jgi:hypothetical protein
MWQRGGVTGFVARLDYPMFVVTVADAGTGERAGCLVGFATQCSINPFRFLVCLSRANRTHRVASRSEVLAGQAAGGQGAQEPQPAGPVLLAGDVQAEDFALPLGVSSIVPARVPHFRSR